MAYTTSQDVYRTAGITTSEVSEDAVNDFIEQAEDYVESRLGTTFQSGGKTKTETIDGTGTDTLFLENYPIKSLTSLTIDGDTVTPSNVYIYSNIGKLKLKDAAEVNTFKDHEPQLITLTYVYGVEPSQRIRRFTNIIAAMMTLISQIGGTFNDVTSYQLPELSASKGEPYTNIRETVQRLRDEAQRMLEQGVVTPYIHVA